MAALGCIFIFGPGHSWLVAPGLYTYFIDDKGLCTKFNVYKKKESLTNLVRTHLPLKRKLKRHWNLFGRCSLSGFDWKKINVCWGLRRGPHPPGPLWLMISYILEIYLCKWSRIEAHILFVTLFNHFFTISTFFIVWMHVMTDNVLWKQSLLILNSMGIYTEMLSSNYMITLQRAVCLLSTAKRGR